MAAFERIDPNGDLNTGKSVFFISDSFGGQVELSQEEAGQAMRWLRSFLDPLPSLHEQRERERAIMAQLAELPIPITITVEHDERGKQFYRWKPRHGWFTHPGSDDDQCAPEAYGERKQNEVYV